MSDTVRTAERITQVRYYRQPSQNAHSIRVDSPSAVWVLYRSEVIVLFFFRIHD